MTHTQLRLKERGINFSDSQLRDIARDCKVDSAVILAKLETHKGDNTHDYYSRTESNGDLVVLIVRRATPVTIMYRRSNQPQTASALKVNAVIDLS